MAEPAAVEFGAPGGESLRIEWDQAALRDGADADGAAWRLSGDLDWDRIAALRVITARLADGRTLLLAALRPVGAEGHGEDAVGALLVDGGETQEIAEPLLSTQYDADGMPSRVGLELYPSEGAAPLRIAADVAEVRRERDGAAERVRATLAVRFEGAETTGAYEIVTAA